MSAITTAFQYEGRTALRRFLIDEAVHYLGNRPPRSGVLLSYHPAYIAAILSKLTNPTVVPKTKSRAAALPIWIKNSCGYHCHRNHPDFQDERKICQSLWHDGGPPQTIGRDMYDKFGSVATLLVDSARTPFIVHKDLLCAKSKYFDSALNGQFAEGQSKCLLLPEESALTFALFVEWLYKQEVRPFYDDMMAAKLAYLHRSINSNAKGSLPTGEEQDDSMELHSETASDYDEDESSGYGTDYGVGDINHEELEQHEAYLTARAAIDRAKASIPEPSITVEEGKRMQSDLIDLYIFADRRSILSLRNAVMDRLVILHLSGWPLLSSTFSNVKRAYQYLQPGSKLCRFLAEEAAWCWSHQMPDVRSRRNLVQLPQEFLGRVLRIKLANVRPWRTSPCNYHDHDASMNTIVEPCLHARKAWEKVRLNDEPVLERGPLPWV